LAGLGGRGGTLAEEGEGLDKGVSGFGGKGGISNCLFVVCVKPWKGLSINVFFLVRPGWGRALDILLWISGYLVENDSRSGVYGSAGWGIGMEIGGE
jgi:hypothetical protein